MSRPLIMTPEQAEIRDLKYKIADLEYKLRGAMELNTILKEQLAKKEQDEQVSNNG